MVFKPVHMEVNPHAIDPNNVYAGLDLSGVCGWIREKKGDPKYSGPGSSSQPTSIPSKSTLGLTLDEEAADSRSIHTQEEWIAYFNQRKESMAFMGDIYLAGKSNNQKLLDSLRADFKQSRIVTSTRIEYGDEFNAKIIHNYGSTLIQPVEHTLIIPEYQPQTLAAVLNTNIGFNYLHCLFGTNDPTNQIKDTLQNLSTYSSDKIVVWSALRSARPTERAAGFEIGGNRFHVYGDIFDYPGCSRGVRL